jgi:hypothetical protein
MARSFRIACLAVAPVAACVVAGAVLGVAPAAAQFINPFEALFGAPPRPPSNVPTGRQQPAEPQQAYPQYPDRQYSDQPYPGQPPPVRQALPDPGVQSQPLPPPDGATAAVPGGPSSLLPPGQRQPRGTPQPGDVAPQPGDEVVTEPPSQKIPNKGAMFSGLDKITGRIIAFDAGIGETVQFGALQVTPRACYTRPPTETPNTDAFLEVDEVTLQGEVKRIFTGWMFAASPGLHAVEHPIYDVWLTDCKNPVVAVAPPPEAAPPPPAQPAKPPPPASPRRSGQAQAAPPQAAPPQAAPQPATPPGAPRR